jgi:hypothetical protein
MGAVANEKEIEMSVSSEVVELEVEMEEVVEEGCEYCGCCSEEPLPTCTCGCHWGCFR